MLAGIKGVQGGDIRKMRGTESGFYLDQDSRAEFGQPHVVFEVIRPRHLFNSSIVHAKSPQVKWPHRTKAAPAIRGDSGSDCLR